MIKLSVPALAIALVLCATGCSGLNYPMDHCVSDERMTQAREAQALVLATIPRERVQEVIFNDGCNDSEEPSSLVFLKGLSNPLEPLGRKPGWKPVSAAFLKEEKVSAGLTRNLGKDHLVVLWGPTSESDLRSDNPDESALSVKIEGFSPAEV